MSENNALKPQESLPTTTPDVELSPSVPPVTHMPTTESEASPPAADPKEEPILISDSKPVIAESERAPEQVTSTKDLSTTATPVVALEQPSAAPVVPGQALVPTSPPENTQVEPVTTQEAPPKPTAKPAESVLVPPANVAEPPMSSTTVPQPTTTERPAETTAVPAVTTTTAATQSQPVADPKLAAQVPTKSQPNETAGAPAEPQNKLTQKFSEAEWSALKEFRALLPEIFAEAYPDQPKARDTSISLWGVTIDPAKPQSDARVSVILMKFLRARHLGVREARTMLINTLRWREEFKVKAAIEEEYPKDIFGTLGLVHGCDKERRPVVYNTYGGSQNLKAVFGDVDRFLRWRVALMEKSVEQIDFNEVDQILQIHDYAGLSISSRDANSKAAASEASNIFQSHYPEFLYKKFFVNLPTVLTWIYWAFKPLVSAETLAKMTIVGTSKSSIRKALLPYMDIKEIPTKYGGEDEGFQVR